MGMALIVPREILTILIEKEVIFDNYYYYTFIVLIMSVFLAVIQNAYAMYFVLEKRLHIISYSYSIAFVVNIIGNFYIKDYGIFAAAVSTLLAFFVVNILQYVYIVGVMKVNRWDG